MIDREPGSDDDFGEEEPTLREQVQTGAVSHDVAALRAGLGEHPDRVSIGCDLSRGDDVTATVARQGWQVLGYVAFEGMVALAKWSESSRSGAKITVKLQDREALAPFEKATKRRGKRAGQRYMVVVSSDKGEPISDAPSELWFAGADWSHQGGASVSFTVDSLEWWRQFQTADQGGDGQVFHFTMVELQANDTPLDQDQADRAERANRPKGGPKSKFAAQRNQTTDFQAYVGYRTGMPKERWRLVGADTCDKWVKQVCGVESKVAFDHDEDAWNRYEKLISRPFITWAHTQFG